MLKTNIKTFCFELILSTPVFNLPVIIEKNVFSFLMYQFLSTELVTLRQICLSNLLTRTNTYRLLAVNLTMLSEAYFIVKPSVYFAFILT